MATEQQEEPVSPVEYRGVDRRGIARTGRMTIANAGELAAERHRAGWRKLTIHADGREVGGISPDPETGQRIWWGEAEATEQQPARRAADLLRRAGQRDAQCDGGPWCRCPVVTPCYPDSADRVDRA